MTEAGTFNVWLAVRDCDNKSAETLFTFEVWGRRYSMATSALPSAALGAPYSATLQTAGVDSNTTWEVTSGSLPAGLTLSKEGVISGTPTVAGSSTFTVQATGNAKDFGGTRVDTKELTLSVVALAAQLSRPTAEVGVPFRASLVGSGGQAPYRWSVTGAPAGLGIAADGTLSGTPRRAGSYTLSAQLVDATGAQGTLEVRLVVRARLAIASGRLPAATAGRGYRANIATRGGGRAAALVGERASPRLEGDSRNDLWTDSCDRNVPRQGSSPRLARRRLHEDPPPRSALVRCAPCGRRS
jgi:hypothetical protein